MGLLVYILITSLLGFAFFADVRRMFSVIRKYLVRKRLSFNPETHTSAYKGSITEFVRRPDTALHVSSVFDSRSDEQSTTGITFSLTSNMEGPLTNQDHFSLPAQSMTSGEELEIFQTAGPRVLASEDEETAGLQSVSFHVQSESNLEFPIGALRDIGAPVQNKSTGDDMPLLSSLMYPSVISTRVYPLEVLGDCFAILLKEVRKGSCTKRGFDSFFTLIQETGAEDHATLEMLLGSAIIYLLVSRMADETFKASGLYEEAFRALVRLMENKNVIKWVLQPEILEVVDWVSREGSLESKSYATIFLFKIALADL